VGYNTAAKWVERMEADGFVGPANHVGRRDIYRDKDGSPLLSRRSGLPLAAKFVPPHPWQHAGGRTAIAQPAHFAPLAPAMTPSLPSNLGLIYDVPLQVSVELGKATKTIKEIFLCLTRMVRNWIKKE